MPDPSIPESRDRTRAPTRAEGAHHHSGADESFVDPEFARALGDPLREACDAYPSSIYGCWPDGRLAYMNPAWQRFAQENAGADVCMSWGIGRNLFDAIPAVLRDFYRERWQRALATGIAEEHEYECSSPNRLRLYQMRLDPLPEGRGMLVRNTLRIDTPREEHAPHALERYTPSHGFVCMCANCRRVRRLGAEEAWDWVPELVRDPPQRISHGICPVCMELYY